MLEYTPEVAVATRVQQVADGSGAWTVLIWKDLAGALEFNRGEARHAAEEDYSEELVTV